MASMMGNAFLGAALALSLGAVLFCASSKESPVGKWAGRLVFLSGIASLATALCLMYFIFADRFDIAYVVGYSSRELPTVYKFSAFWAGQQGSFLLWLFFHAAVGVLLLRGKQMDSAAMGIYMLLQSVIAILVLGKSPFALQEAAVEDGMGLNPLLQDPWMAVHPPIIFLGYAMLAIPLAYSAGALLRRKGDADWMEPARRWTLAAWAFLGAGIFIGGYWAYKVLGWGGYWGWDPVENSSLVPWLVAAVFLHLLKGARVRKPILPMAHLAAIFAFSLVLYGTFLTRSGLLGDFSVHSFSGTSIGLAITVANAVILLGGLALLTARVNDLPKGNMYEGSNSREFLLLLGMLLMVFVAAVVFLGMSMPLLTQLAGRPAAMDTSFYVRTTMPLAICLMLAMTVACQRFYGVGKLLPKSNLPLAALVAGVALPLAVGVREILPVVLSGVSLMASAASIQSWKNRALSLGGMIAHVGVGIALSAMVLAGSGSQSVTEVFSLGETHRIFGHEITYQGQEFLEDGSAKYYVYRVDGREIKALTKLRSNGTDAAREPAIDRGGRGDIYIAPSPAEDAGIGEMTLKRNEIAMDGEFAYIFEDGEIRASEGNGEHMLATARISVTDGEIVDVVEPTIIVTRNSGTSKPVSVLKGKKRIRLTGLTEDQKKARIEILPSEAELAQMPVQATVSEKPLIWALWLGCALVTVGCMTAVWKGRIR